MGKSPSGTETLLLSKGEIKAAAKWTPLPQQLFSRQMAQLLKPQGHLKERSWCYTTSQPTGALLAEGSPPCWPSSTKQLLSLELRLSLYQPTRMKRQCSPIWRSLMATGLLLDIIL